jgi:hypothetical protein
LQLLLRSAADEKPSIATAGVGEPSRLAKWTHDAAGARILTLPRWRFMMTSRHVLSTCRSWLAVAVLPFVLPACNSPSDPANSDLVTAQRTSMPAAVPAATTPAQLIDALAAAYRARDPGRFAALLDADYLFVVDPAPNGPGQWNAVEERRIHQRMFRPMDVPPSEDPVPEELWALRLLSKFTPREPFAERPEFYQSPSNPNGVDPARFKVWGAEYDTWIFFEMQGETDYEVTGRALFTVKQSLAGPFGSAPDITLYRWEDLGGGWTGLKGLYR